MLYTEKVIDHFQHPRNQGVIADADAIGQEGNMTCGDIMKIYLKVGEGQAGASTIDQISFETFGCAAAIAVSSALTEYVKGKTLDQALAVTKDEIVSELGGLPAPKVHCSMLGVDALHQAIKQYQDSHKS